ncbi:conserved hypothetical protein [Trichinella spiralis]|uniref:hypothetical protein n=1 Tax=Trichinella spiralis TaxID=6334 RepID=UPI0001EFD379|nr:conserved hypothetical protein [Trichinella spiralis]
MGTVVNATVRIKPRIPSLNQWYVVDINFLRTATFSNYRSVFIIPIEQFFFNKSYRLSNAINKIISFIRNNNSMGHATRRSDIQSTISLVEKHEQLTDSAAHWNGNPSAVY